MAGSPSNQSSLPLGPSADLQQQAQNGPVSFNSPDPGVLQQQAHMQQLGGLISSLGGLAANVASISRGTGAAGEQALQSGKELSDQANATNASLNKEYQSRAAVQQLAGMVPQLRDPNHQAIAMQYGQNGDAEKMQSYIERQLDQQRADDRYNAYMAKVNRSMGRSDASINVNESNDLVKDFAGAEKEATAALKQHPAYNAMQVEKALTSLSADPSKVSLANLAVQNPKLFGPILKNKEAAKAFNSALQDQISSKEVPATVLGAQMPWKTMPQGAKSSDIFNGISSKLVSPEIQQEFAGRMGQVQQAQENLQEAKVIQSMARDPKKGAEVQQRIDALRLKLGGAPGTNAQTPPTIPAGVSPADWAALSPEGQSRLLMRNR